MLEEYCLVLGIRVFDDRFYAGNGLLAEIPNPLTEGDARERTLIR
jgi:hypothetical protein